MTSDDAGQRDIFKDHVATYEAHNENLETLQWRKPGDSHYAIWFVRHHGVLMVWGDCYEATYMWNNQPGFGLRWIVGCSLDYFVSKCRASSRGRDPRIWDSAELSKDLREYFSDGCTWTPPMCSEGACEDCDQRRKEAALFEEYSGWSFMEDEYTSVAWLRERGYDVIG